jgi:hypothetical protein
VIDRQHPESTAREARYRAVLVVLLTVVGAIAVVGGGVGMVLGAVTGPEEQHVAVSTSSEYRFLSGVWLVLGVALWWSLVRPASRSAVTRVVLIAAIGGGVGRLVSLLVEGWPGPSQWRSRSSCWRSRSSWCGTFGRSSEPPADP